LALSTLKQVMEEGLKRDCGKEGAGGGGKEAETLFLPFFVLLSVSHSHGAHVSLNPQSPHHQGY